MTKSNPLSFEERADKVQKNLDSNVSLSVGPSFKTMAYQTSADMIASVLVGCGLGFVVEHFLSIKPWGMVVGFFLGATAGLLNVYRRLVKIGYGFGK